jgi:hypothetical protein
MTDDTAGQVKLRPAQMALIEALAGGTSYTDAATAIGVSRPTVARWAAQPAIRQAVAERRREHFAHIAARLASLADEAIDTLAAGLAGTAKVPQVRAAAIVLDHVLRYHDATATADALADIAERLTAIEANA